MEAPPRGAQYILGNYWSRQNIYPILIALTSRC